MPLALHAPLMPPTLHAPAPPTHHPLAPHTPLTRPSHSTHLSMRPAQKRSAQWCGAPHFWWAALAPASTGGMSAAPCTSCMTRATHICRGGGEEGGARRE